MDLTDYFIYDEFLNPGTKYECQKCGTQLGDECVTWDEQAQGHVAVCPGYGNHGIIDRDTNGTPE